MLIIKLKSFLLIPYYGYDYPDVVSRSIYNSLDRIMNIRNLCSLEIIFQNSASLLKKKGFDLELEQVWTVSVNRSKCTYSNLITLGPFQSLLL
jgi:hypothetical protein